MTEPTGLNQKVAQLLIDAAAQIAALGGIDTSVDAIRGPELSTLDNLKAGLDATQAAVEALAAQLQDVLGVREEGNLNTVWIFLDEMNDKLEELINNVGIPTGDATTTVLGRLAAIERLSRCNCPPEPPDLTDPSSPCAEPYISNPFYTRTVSDYPGRLFAGWTAPPPYPLTMDSFLTVPADPCELNRPLGSTGYSIYVQSTAQLASLNPLFAIQTRTNEWVSLDAYSEDMCVSVPAGNDLTVYICLPSDLVWTDCEVLDSTAVTYSTDAPLSIDAQGIVLSSIPGLETTQDWFADSQEQHISVEGVVVTTDMFGVTVTLKSGTGLRIYWVPAGDNAASHDITVIDDSYTLTAHTHIFFISNVGFSSAASSPFEVEICPPGE